MKDVLWFSGKILVELVPLFVLATYLSSLFSQSLAGSAVSRLLRTRRGDVSGRAGAAVAGAVTPFCSCGSVPIVAGLLRAGVPLGIALTFSGWKVTVACMGFSLLIAFTGAAVVERLVPPAEAVRGLTEKDGLPPSAPQDSWHARHKAALGEVGHTLRKIGPWLLAAAVVGAQSRQNSRMATRFPVFGGR